MKRAFAATVFAASSMLATGAYAVTVDWDAYDNAANGTQQALDGRFVEVGLTAGTYEVSILDGAYTSMSYWDRNSGCNAAGEECSKGWEASYDIINSSGDHLVNFTPRFDDPTSSRIYATQQQALESGQSEGPTPFTLENDGSIFVGAFDNKRSDNRGGMSLDVAEIAPVPVPAGGLLLVGALGLGGLVTRRRRSAS